MPDRLSWLRPFAMTGALTLEHPLAGVSTNIGIDPQSGQLAAMPTAAVDTLHWGFRSSTAPTTSATAIRLAGSPRTSPCVSLSRSLNLPLTRHEEKNRRDNEPGIGCVSDSWELSPRRSSRSTAKVETLWGCGQVSFDS